MRIISQSNPDSVTLKENSVLKTLWSESNTTTQQWQKFGIYRWDPWVGSATRTTYSKGMYILKDAAGTVPLNEQTMMNLLNEI